MTYKIRPLNIQICKNCHKRRKKCSRGKPICERCLKLNKVCEYFTDAELFALAVAKHKAKNDNISADSNKIRNEDIITSKSISKLQKNNDKLSSPLISSCQCERIDILNFEKTPNLKLFFILLDSKIQFGCNTIPSIQYPMIMTPSVSIDNIKELISTKEKFDPFVSYFFDFIHVWIPVINYDDFLTNYDLFWNNYNHEFDSKFAMILLAIKFVYEVQIWSTMPFECLKDTANNINTIFQYLDYLKFVTNMINHPHLEGIKAFSVTYYFASPRGYDFYCKIPELIGYSKAVNLSEKDFALSLLLKYFEVIIGSNKCNDPSYMQSHMPESFENVNFLDIICCDSLNMIISREIINPQMTSSEKLEYLKRIFCEHSKHYENRFKSILLRNNETNSNYIYKLAQINHLKNYREVDVELSILDLICKGSENFIENTNCILKMLLYLNECVMFTRLCSKNIKGKWLLRAVFPYFSILLLLLHIHKYPREKLSFKNIVLPYSELEGIDYKLDDIRAPLVKEGLNILTNTKKIWSLQQQHCFNDLDKLQKLIL